MTEQIQIKNIGIIGVGLIGGSFALALKRSGFVKKVWGIDHNEKHLESAKKLNIIDDFCALTDAYQHCDAFIICIPVDATKKLLPNILDDIEEQIVIDAGSTKSGICNAVLKHPKRKQFIAAHPIAGTENSGPEAALVDLFQHKINIICNPELSDEKYLNAAVRLFESVEMKNHFMDAEEHDRHIAYVSHLSHISSFVLGKTVLEIEKDEKNIFNMAGSGFASTVRLAKSSPQMWAPIFQQNQVALKNALAAYIKNLEDFKLLIEAGDSEKLTKLMEDANRIRKVID